MFLCSGSAQSVKRVSNWPTLDWASDHELISYIQKGDIVCIYTGIFPQDSEEGSAQREKLLEGNLNGAYHATL